MAILKVTIPETSSKFKMSTCCACCTELAEQLMVIEKTPSRGTDKVGFFHLGCWEKIWTESELEVLDPKWGTQTSDGLEYLYILFPEKFNARLHADLIDKAHTKSGGQRKAQWYFMGDRYRSPKFQSGRSHGHLKNIEKFCAAGTLVVKVFKDGELVDSDELSWGVRNSEGRFCKRTDVYFEGCKMVNELANRNRKVQIDCDARTKKEKAAAAKARK